MLKPQLLERQLFERQLLNEQLLARQLFTPSILYPPAARARRRTIETAVVFHASKIDTIAASLCGPEGTVVSLLTLIILTMEVKYIIIILNSAITLGQNYDPYNYNDYYHYYDRIITIILC